MRFRALVAGTQGRKTSLRAKGTLMSEPRFSTPCEMRFFPREKGETAFVEGFSLKRPFSLSCVGKIASRRGRESKLTDWCAFSPQGSFATLRACYKGPKPPKCPKWLGEGARLRGRTAAQRSKKGSEKVLERVLGKGSQKGSEKGAWYGFYSKKGSEKGSQKGF